MRNQEVASLLYSIADLLESQRDEEWKARAYRRAAGNIERLEEDVQKIYDRDQLQQIDGVGESIENKIKEYLETGELEYYEELKKEV